MFRNLALATVCHGDVCGGTFFTQGISELNTNEINKNT
jgi:hypothetical protein